MERERAQLLKNRIDSTLTAVIAEGRTALVPYVTVGFPGIESSESIVEGVIGAGADMVELGVPFSDPLADGPTIQMTSFRALQNSVTLATCLDMVSRLRDRGVEAPLILMGYYNPFLHRGPERFTDEAGAAGVDGIIVPDLPPEESGPFRALCQAQGIHLVPLLAPTSTDERIARACEEAGGFIYCVGLTGVTGARSLLPSGLSDLVDRIRRHTELPILVGFGVSRREHVEAIDQYADGAVVGSALLDAIDKAPEGQATAVAKSFVLGLKGRTE